MNQRTHEPSNFYIWLLKQIDKDTPVGDLARDAKGDPSFPRAGSTIDPFKDYLMKISGDSLIIRALEDAWSEYSESNVSEITGLTKP